MEKMSGDDDEEDRIQRDAADFAKALRYLTEDIERGNLDFGKAPKKAPKKEAPKKTPLKKPRKPTAKLTKLMKDAKALKMKVAIRAFDEMLVTGERPDFQDLQKIKAEVIKLIRPLKRGDPEVKMLDDINDMVVKMIDLRDIPRGLLRK